MKHKKIIIGSILLIIVIGIVYFMYYCIVNHNLATVTVSGQIIDVKDTAFIDNMESTKEPYMVKYESNGQYYISLKNYENLPSKFQCSKEEYDKIKSGSNYYMFMA